MGCGCGRKGASARRAPMANGGMRLIQPTVGPQPVLRGLAAGVSPAKLQAQALATNISPPTAVTVAHLNADKRRIEKLRRKAIQQALNK